MPKTVTISLPEKLEKQIDDVVIADYGNTSEFFRAAARELLRKRQQEKLEAMLVETIENGDFSPVTGQDFKDIKKRGLERVKNLKQKSK